MTFNTEKNNGPRFCIRIGGIPIILSAPDPHFIETLKCRYANFVCDSPDEQALHFAIDLMPTPAAEPDADLEVHFEAGRWTMCRGDFRAEWDPAAGGGVVRQSPYPYAIDSVIRIVLSLMLAPRGGFLIHSASAVRSGRAFLFSGVSGAGKTTIARLAPPDAILFSDEISCVRWIDSGYHAFGTPFAGELGIAGEPAAAPIRALYFLRKGPRNAVATIDRAPATAALLRNILFFTDDAALVKQVFATACDFAAHVTVGELTFRPDRSVWELIK